MLLKVFLFKKEQYNDINVELIKDHSSTIPMDASTNYQVTNNTVLCRHLNEDKDAE